MIDRLVRVLEHSTVPQPAEMLARRARLDPAEVRRGLSRLRRAGVAIECVPGARGGYRFAADVLAATAVVLADHGRAGRFGRAVEYHRTIGSTNDRATELAVAARPEGTVVIADEQTRGRGRLKRPWVSVSGVGVYLSAIVRPPIPPSRAPELSFVSAVAIAEAVRAETRLPVEIKWPNDLLAPRRSAARLSVEGRASRAADDTGNGHGAGGRKMAGVLAEMHATSHAIRHIIIGIGLNVNHDAATFPAELRATATSLALETGRCQSRVLIACRVLERLEAWYARYLRAGFAPILARWRALSTCWNGAEVEVQAFDRVVRGVTAGIDADGAILVRTGDGAPERFSSGEIVYFRQC